MLNIAKLQKSIISGNRIALGQAITLIESQKSADREQAGNLLANLLKYTGNSLRIGITGIPGVGKSTFIEAMGSLITSQGKKLAVLAIDPSSPHSKGSILGDKTRMHQLATNANAFIRPSAAGGHLGGVANKSMETILLCEAAGYDVIIVETVGVGQSEIAVKNMTDVFVLLMLAGAGDELQGIKRGIMEMADILVINKADGDNIPSANLAKKAYENAIHLFTTRDSGWIPPVLTCSSLTGEGVESVWQKLNEFQTLVEAGKLLELNRNVQKKHWLEQTLGAELMRRIKADEKVKARLPELENQVVANKITAMQAVNEIMQTFFR
jgi:LAO/AO transport system kinase